jgi:hypothetical protein
MIGVPDLADHIKFETSFNPLSWRQVSKRVTDNLGFYRIGRRKRSTVSSVPDLGL